MTQVFYNWSGGLESSAMLCLDIERIRETGACVRWADTGKHFPEMAQSKSEIEAALGLSIVTVDRRITFDEFLFEKGGMIRKGTTDCSRRMKRSNLMRHLQAFPKPWEVNLGFNADEAERADAFSARNDREWCKWRYPLIERGIKREDTWDICRKAGFKTLVAMYEKMGRFDCFWCGNQTPKQAKLVAKHYPELAAEWKAAEARKGHSFMRVPLQILEDESNSVGPLFAGCSCFGGDDDVWEDAA
jgi:3'-phosphoadenosine 5'-phosphosulfate sulfotransferase (PAPS reductase)/FAD synthetase